MIAAAEHEWKRRLRFGAYVGAALREAMRLTPAVFRITADGAEVEIVGLVVLIANTGDLIGAARRTPADRPVGRAPGPPRRRWPKSRRRGSRHDHVAAPDR